MDIDGSFEGLTLLCALFYCFQINGTDVSVIFFSLWNVSGDEMFVCRFHQEM